MVTPRLRPSEIEAIETAAAQQHELTRSKLPLGSWEARAGRHRVFCTGSQESFEALWQQAQEVYTSYEKS